MGCSGIIFISLLYVHHLQGVVLSVFFNEVAETHFCQGNRAWKYGLSPTVLLYSYFLQILAVLSNLQEGMQL